MTPVFISQGAITINARGPHWSVWAQVGNWKAHTKTDNDKNLTRQKGDWFYCLANSSDISWGCTKIIRSCRKSIIENIPWMTVFQFPLALERIDMNLRLVMNPDRNSSIYCQPKKIRVVKKVQHTYYSSDLYDMIYKYIYIYCRNYLYV